MAMAMLEPFKGKATPLASMFPVEEAQKAAKRVHDKIAEKQQELHKLRSFLADNTSLVNLVERLPDELHHDIMVPFGKAAFFPGRLIHTNEFLVLLGEGYYAERTSRQTMEILKRRGKALDAQMDSLKATMRDLEAEALFFNSTASEAAEGLVEIIEDYVKESSMERESESGPDILDSTGYSDKHNGKVAIDDEEYARLMSKLEELEKEELAEGSGSENDNDAEAGSNQFPDESSTDSIGYSQGLPLGKPAQQSKAEHTSMVGLMNEDASQRLLTDQLNLEGLTVQSLPREINSSEKSLSQNLMKFGPQKDMILPAAEEEIIPVGNTSKSEVPEQTPRPVTDNAKAFTGSIVERTHNLQTNPRQQYTTTSQAGSQTSKPVSRFKMQRR